MSMSAPASSSSSALQTSNTNVRQPSDSGAALASFRTLLGRVSLSACCSLSAHRPWRELFDRSAFSRPASLSEAASSLRRNASYFRVNYASVLATVLATHPFSLFILLSLATAWLFLYAFRPSDQPLVLIGRPFSNCETLAFLSFLTLLVVFLTSVGSLLISANPVGLGIVASHGAFRDPEDLFLDEQDSLGSAGGLFSYIASSSSVASSMTIASRF